jgi:hypothetical protein
MKFADGKKFFVEYKKIDKKAKGEINFEMFAKHYKIPKDDQGVMKRFFSTLKKDKINGEDVYFQEWACMIYDFATAGMDGIQEWIVSHHTFLRLVTLIHIYTQNMHTCMMFLTILVVVVNGSSNEREFCVMFLKSSKNNTHIYIMNT